MSQKERFKRELTRFGRVSYPGALMKVVGIPTLDRG
jgi:hypothetical protein